MYIVSIQKMICGKYEKCCMLHESLNLNSNLHSFPQIPVLMNAVGGILVGLVTSYAGGIKKASA